MLDKIEKAKVLILGFGVEGQATLSFLQEKFPGEKFAVADKSESPLRGLGGVKPKLEEDFSTASAIADFGRNDATLENVKCFLGEDYLKNLNEFDLIIKSPGIKPDLPELVEFKKQGGEITSATNLFMAEVKGTVIGITGSKGKSTVSSLLYAILKEAGKKVELIGNIGNPALEVLENDSKEKVYVFEMSSYQIEDLQKKPQYVLINNLFPEHLDYHGSLESYYVAKLNIVSKVPLSKGDTGGSKSQNEEKSLNPLYSREVGTGEGGLTQKVFYNTGSKELVERIQNSKSELIPFNDGKNSRIENGKLIYQDEEIVEVEEIKLLGKHNLENILGVIALSKEFGVGSDVIGKAIRGFKGLEHRLEYVGEFKEIHFYNDSISTTPESTIQAIEALGDDLDTLILGGLDRGYDFTELAELILKSQIRSLILFPETGEKIHKEILRQAQDDTHKVPLEKGDIGGLNPQGKQNPPNPLYSREVGTGEGGLKTFFVDNMEQCVKTAFEVTKKNKVCLLSPAAPSYNLFKNFIERGKLYKKIIQKNEN